MNSPKIDNTELEEYLERNRRWTDKAMAQLSFLNSLILTLGLGFISLAYSKLKDVELVINIKNPDKEFTYYSISLIIIGVSIFIGLFIAHNRSVNFRITRHLNTVRLWAYKHADLKFDNPTPEKYGFGKRLWLQFKYCIDFPRIKIEDVKKMKESENKELTDTFQLLRNAGHNMGVSTWYRTNWQILFFTIGLAIYFLAMIMQ